MMTVRLKTVPSIRTFGLVVAVLAISLVVVPACFSAAPSECVEAAEAAGLPDEVIEQLRNPGDLNAIERAALRRILDQAGIDDVCNAASEAPVSQSIPDPAQSDEPNPGESEEPDESEKPKGHKPSPQSGRAYAECLDDVYLRASDDYESSYWLSAAIWYCRDLAPIPQAETAIARCNLNQIEVTEQRYPEWSGILHRWYALAICNPLPTPDATYIGTNSDLQPTVFSACMDNAYLTNADLVGDGEVAIGVSAWLCRDYLPDPPEHQRQRCDLNRISETQELYPEWPEKLHNWHAIMQCLPEWHLRSEPEESTYTTCLGDVYLQVADRYPKDHAIPAAVWRCLHHMPEPPDIYNPRCEINHHKRNEESQIQWPDELYAWNAIVQCYPKYRA